MDLKQQVKNLTAIITLLGFIKLGTTCPHHCSCQGNIVRCYGIGLTMIPDDLPNSTVELDLQNNHIKIIEKHKLDSLSHLIKLKLRENNITEIKPETFDALQKLEHVDLEVNQISSLPADVFSKLPALKALYLADNSLTSLDGVLAGLSNLERLTLQKNSIQSLDSDVFRDLGKLEHLTISHNNISFISPSTFFFTPKLMLLVLSSNPLGKADNILDRNLQLNFIDLTNCSLTSFPAGIPWTVRYLKLSDNHFQQISKLDLIDLQFLVIIILESCQLSHIEAGAFSHLGFLNDVFLIGNNLTSIPGPLPHSVKNIHMDNNAVGQIHPTSFQHGTKLYTLSMANNNISRLDSNSFLNVRTIYKLVLTNNPLQELVNNTFTTMDGLSELHIDNVNLESIEEDFFFGATNLTTLQMAYVSVKASSIHGNIFKHISDLVDLDVEGSPTLARKFFKYIDTFTSLGSVNLMDNNLRTLSSDLLSLTSLRTIKLSGNRLHCDSRLLWLRNWMLRDISLFPSKLSCHKPHSLQGRSITEVPPDEFLDPVTTATEVTTSSDNNVTTWTPTNQTVPDYYDSIDTWDYYSWNSKENTSHYMSVSTDVTTDAITDVTPVTALPHNETNITVAIEASTRVGTSTTTEQQQPQEQEEDKDKKLMDADSDEDGGNSKAVGIGVAGCLSVLCVMLLISAVIFYFWQKKNRVVHHRARQYEQKNDYVFIISNKDVAQDNRQRKLTREERGSTTSKASEDITNNTDTTMKVFTWDE